MSTISVLQSSQESKHIGWSLSARHTVTKGSSDGHRQTKCWVLIARTAGIECPFHGVILGHYFEQANCSFLYLVDYNFVFFYDASW